MAASEAEYQPASTDTIQDDYVSRPGQNEVPVVSDSSNIEDPIDSSTADSDEQLGKHSIIMRTEYSS